jgi:curved DNA-binding protein CbpA
LPGTGGHPGRTLPPDDSRRWDLSTRAFPSTDYYELLGVDRDASTEEIARAFRTLAKDHHPDRTDDSDARDRFTALSAAYGVLGDPQRRSRYDAAGATRRLDAAPPADRYQKPHPIQEANRPLSVRALPERRYARWASIGGASLFVIGVAAAALTLWLATSGPSRTTNGSDPTGRDVTLALVALKLIVVGIVFVTLGNRRRRYP